MNEGIALGLAAAISFGSSDVCAALTSRRVGAIRGATGTIAVSLVLLLLTTAILQPALPADPAWILPVLALGGIVGIGYLSLVNALRLGPISVVSPVFGSIGAVTVLFAVVLLGDRPGALEWVAVAATTAGVVLVALTRRTGETARFTNRGPAFAMLAVVAYSISIVLLQDPIRAVGWLPALVVWRFGNLLVAGSVLLVGERRHRDVAAPLEPDVVVEPGADLPPGRRGVVIGLLLTGLLESLGQVTRGLGLAVAPAWLIGLVTSLGPVVVIAAGVVLLHERLNRSQWAGIALVGVGVALLALA